MDELSLEDQNWAVLMLNQALIGAISPNFRMVELAFENSRWVIRVTLSEDRIKDREEIEEVVDDFSKYLMDLQGRIDPRGEAEAVADIRISAEPIIVVPAMMPRLVFLARQRDL